MSSSKQTQQSKLLGRAAEGSKQAFGSLYKKYLDEIYRYAFYKVGNSMIAEDITEETFLKAWDSLAKTYSRDNGITNFRAWLYRIANHLCIDYYRKKKPVEIFENQIKSKDLTPEQAIDKKILSHNLTAAIQKLEPKFKQIIILRFINQLTHQETAATMEISGTYSRVLQFRAVKKLKEILLNEGENHVQDD
jgi:RNA polymerase sigma-70 factor, ECF subfamily